MLYEPRTNCSDTDMSLSSSRRSSFDEGKIDLSAVTFVTGNVRDMLGSPYQPH